MWQKVIRAQFQIADILKELESSTGRAVDEIAISRMDMTSIESPTREFQRGIRITLGPKPGDQWEG